MHSLFVRHIVLTAATLLSFAASAQEFPTKPIRIVVPFAPGASVDFTGRLYGRALQDMVHQPVIIENRGGAGTLVGTRAVKDAPADGYTLMITTNSVVVNAVGLKPTVYRMSDFATLTGVGTAPFALLAHSSVPAKTLAEVIRYANQNPDKLNFGSLGDGGLTRLLAERFKSAAGIKVVDVPYKGGAPLLQALVAGEIQLCMQGVSAVIPQLKTGTIRAYALTAQKRTTSLPDIPTFAESGMPTLIGGVWYAAYARAETPREVLQNLRKWMQEISVAANVRDALQKVNIDPWAGTFDEFQAFASRDEELVAKDIERFGLGTP